MVLALAVEEIAFQALPLGSHHWITYPRTSAGLWRRQESVTGTRKELRAEGRMLRSQRREPGSGTVTVTRPVPAKEPAGIFRVQSPFRSSPPRAPSTVTDTTFAPAESGPAPGPPGSAANACVWPECCTGDSGEVEHPASRRRVAMVGNVRVRDRRNDL